MFCGMAVVNGFVPYRITVFNNFIDLLKRLAIYSLSLKTSLKSRAKKHDRTPIGADRYFQTLEMIHQIFSYSAYISYINIRLK